MSDELISIELFPLDAEGNDISMQEPMLPLEATGYQVPAPGDFLWADGRQWLVLRRLWGAPFLQKYGTKQGKQAVTLFITPAGTDAARSSARQRLTELGSEAS